MKTMPRNNTKRITEDALFYHRGNLVVTARLGFLVLLLIASSSNLEHSLLGAEDSWPAYSGGIAMDTLPVPR